MKIDDFSITLFAWNDIPPHSYLGRDPLAREQLYQEMLERRLVVQPWVVGAVDVALWDLAGKAAGEPVHRLLGTYREKLPAYASSEQQPDVEAYVEQALSYLAAGWQGYKVHPFRIWRDDMRICRAVREAVGDGFPLMLDSTWGYDYPSALRVGKLIEELDFEWYEDPATEFPGAWYDSFAPWIYTT